MKHHRREINRWADRPDGTNVWYREKRHTEWVKVVEPGWYNNFHYIVDDEHSEIRKQFIDNASQIEIYDECSSKWVPNNFENLLKFDGFLWNHTSDCYRIKPKTVTKWKWVIYDSETRNYFITSGFYTGEEGNGNAFFICKIEETRKEVE